jgi:membrane fusion protein (multidrug efflux system)
LVVDSQGHADLRQLEIAGAIGNQWRVTSGLGPGDRLIVVGGANAKPGQPVKVVPAPPAAAPATAF